MAERTRQTGATRFHRYIEARYPDPAEPGWDVLKLSCGHRSGAPSNSRNFEKAHCADCQLAHEEHQRALEQVQKQIAAKQPKEPVPDAEPDYHL